MLDLNGRNIKQKKIAAGNAAQHSAMQRSAFEAKHKYDMFKHYYLIISQIQERGKKRDFRLENEVANEAE